MSQSNHCVRVDTAPDEPWDGLQKAGLWEGELAVTSAVLGSGWHWFTFPDPGWQSWCGLSGRVLHGTTEGVWECQVTWGQLPLLTILKVLFGLCGSFSGQFLKISELRASASLLGHLQQCEQISVGQLCKLVSLSENLRWDLTKSKLSGYSLQRSTWTLFLRGLVHSASSCP